MQVIISVYESFSFLKLCKAVIANMQLDNGYCACTVRGRAAGGLRGTSFVVRGSSSAVALTRTDDVSLLHTTAGQKPGETHR